MTGGGARSNDGVGHVQMTGWGVGQFTSNDGVWDRFRKEEEDKEDKEDKGDGQKDKDDKDGREERERAKGF